MLKKKHANPHFWKLLTFYNLLLWTVAVISSKHPGKDVNARFTTLPLKALSGQVTIRYPCL